MSFLSHRGPSRTLTAALTLALVLAPAARPCTAPCVTGGFQVVWMGPSGIVLGDNSAEVTLRIKNYKTFGGTSGDYCACGVLLDDDGVQVESVAFYYAGTDDLLPGFDTFLENGVTSADWAAAPAGGWQGFVAPVTSTLPANTLVDLEFVLKIDYAVGFAGKLGNCGEGDLNTGLGTVGPCSPDEDEVMERVAEVLETAMVGTDAASAGGSLLDHHQHIEALSSDVQLIGNSYDLLDGGIDGGLGPLSLTGHGAFGDGLDGSLDLSGAKGSTAAFVVMGFTPLEAPLKGGVLIPNPDYVLPVITSPSGGFELAWADLPALFTTFEMYSQAWQPDRAAVKGFAASNGLRLTWQVP